MKRPLDEQLVDGVVRLDAVKLVGRPRPIRPDEQHESRLHVMKEKILRAPSIVRTLDWIAREGIRVVYVIDELGLARWRRRALAQLPQLIEPRI